MSDWSVYVLASTLARRTYVGYTRTATLARRLRQHNGVLKGGAKATAGCRPWQMVVSVDGLERRPAMQLEWRMHRRYSGPRGIAGRLGQLATALGMERWTSTAPPVASISSLKITWYTESISTPEGLTKWLAVKDL